VIIDAFSQGVPVITSRTEGVLEIINEEQDALTYGIDAAEHLAEQVVRFAGSPELRDKLAKNALASAQGRSHKAMHEVRKNFLLRHEPVRS